MQPVEAGLGRGVREHGAEVAAIWVDTRGGVMDGSESPKSGLVYTVELDRGVSERGSLTTDWRGRVSDLGEGALRILLAEALEYARWEIGRYRIWRGLDEPVLPSGYDAEGVVQAAFERLLMREGREVQSVECRVQNADGAEEQRREVQSAECRVQNADGGVIIFHSVEGIRQELRMLIKHRVRWLHERKETELVASEWDVMPPGPDGELVSVFECIPGGSASPDEELMGKEKDQWLGKVKAECEARLVARRDLLEVFRRIWEGQKRREIARALGMGVERVKTLQAQVRRRLRTDGADGACPP